MHIVLFIIGGLVAACLSLLWVAFVALAWCHKPVPMREIIREMIYELRCSRKERK